MPQPMPENVTRIRSTEINTRIGVLETQVQHIDHTIEKLDQRVNTQYETIHSRISDLREDMRKEICDKHEQLVEKLDVQAEVTTSQHKDIQAKIMDIEKWRWILVGGAIVVGYFIAHMKLENFF
jgi:hypothetical protein